MSLIQESAFQNVVFKQKLFCSGLYVLKQYSMWMSDRRGINLGMVSANEKCYDVMMSLIAEPIPRMIPAD